MIPVILHKALRKEFVDKDVPKLRDAAALLGWSYPYLQQRIDGHVLFDTRDMYHLLGKLKLDASHMHIYFPSPPLEKPSKKGEN